MTTIDKNADIIERKKFVAASPSSPGGHSRSLSVESDLEQELWCDLQPYQWEKSITRGFFLSLYQSTINEITDVVKQNDIECVLEVGCGTGQVIGKFAVQNRDLNLLSIGIDINKKFIDYCSKKTEYEGLTNFFVADALALNVWKENLDLFNPGDKKLVFCVNNTMSILPESIRANVVREMQKVAGPNGHVLITYWNGSCFKQGVEQYYARNQQLCGSFVIEDQDFVGRKLLTDTGYTSYWPYVHEVMELFLEYCEDRSTILSIKQLDKGVCVLLKGTN